MIKKLGLRAHPNSRLFNEMEIFHSLVKKYKVKNILVTKNVL